MKILVVSATENEILPAKTQIKANDVGVCIQKYTVVDNLSVDFLVTGIGGVSTSYALTKSLAEKKYDWIINAGIAGSFNNDLKVGETVFVKVDELADIGIEDKEEFYTMFEKGFGEKDEYPFTNGKLENPNSINYKIRNVSAITVNRTHGNKKSIEIFKSKFKADIETMEGAAFFYVCLREGVKFLQVRTISNYVEERNKASWDIPLAIKNLNEELLKVFNVLKK